MYPTVTRFRLFTMKSHFFEPPRETKMWFEKIGEEEKSMVKLQRSTEERGMAFGSSYREVRKNC